MSEHRQVQHVLVVGAGAIGSSWAAHFLLHGLQVSVADPVEQTHDVARARVERFVEQGASGTDVTGKLRFVVDAIAAARSAADGNDEGWPPVDLVVEAGPERLDFKRELFAGLDEVLDPDVLLTSSSSGLLPSSFSGACQRHPERVLVAHPFNPPHLVPLVELVPAEQTSDAAMNAAEAFFTGVDKRTIRVRRELPGHVVNRLQAALWREAYYLVGTGAVSVADIDTAIASGPGLRWALLGPFATQHLSGGGHGIAHVLAHLGPPMLDWWDDLGHPELTDELVSAIVTGVDAELDGADEDDLLRRRDEALAALIRLKHDAGLP